MISCRRLCVFLLMIAVASCKPKIYSFSASPRIITNSDSVHLNWVVRGKPQMTFHQKKIRYFASDSLQLLQFTLVVVKGSSRTAPRLLEIKVLPLLYRDILVFPVSGLHGDTLVASGIKDSLYQDFKIESMASMSSRKMLVEHGVYQTMLYDSNVRAKTFKDLDYSGPWKFQSLLTPEEKANSKLIPDQFMISVFIKPKKP
jgi:hypothetical protein